MSHSSRFIALPSLVLIAGAAVPTVASAADSDAAALKNPATAQELPQVIVIGNTPLQGLGLPLNQIPSNVQTANASDIQRQQSLDITDYINNNFSGINISESQDNPFQPDINYHGFTASPLLGTPEGLSVYVDGVRVNESGRGEDRRNWLSWQYPRPEPDVELRCVPHAE
jgi:iron complex outermembrane recepter protein